MHSELPIFTMYEALRVPQVKGEERAQWDRLKLIAHVRLVAIDKKWYETSIDHLTITPLRLVVSNEKHLIVFLVRNQETAWYGVYAVDEDTDDVCVV